MTTIVERRQPPSSLSGNKRLLIGGEWVPALSGRSFDSIDPSTGQTLATIADGAADDVDRAVAAARAAFDGPWSRFTPAQRAKVLLRFAEIMDTHSQELLLTDVFDMGSPVGIPRPGSTPSDTLEYFAGWPTKIYGETIPNSQAGALHTFTLREPVGVVGSIIAWNNPVGAAIYKIAPVLASGCTMVLKPADPASLGPLRIAELAQELDLPPGVINVVTGGGPAGAALSAHPDVDMVAFTGSTGTGQAIMRTAAGSMKRLSLELGGKSPHIIFDDADLDVAAPAAAMGVFGNTGQACVAGARVLVQRGVYEQVVQRMAQVARALRVGPSADPTTQIGPLVTAQHLDRVSGYLAAGRDAGARLAAGGERAVEGELADGFFVRPTVFADVDDRMSIAREEIFGPVASVMAFDDEDDAIRRGNDSPFGLASGVWTRDIGRAHRMARRIKAGIVWVNTYQKFDPAVPFGGYRMSGIGKELGRAGIEQYFDSKSVWIETS